MTIRNLESLFRPESVALIGATPRPGSVGSVLGRNLLSGGFGGEVALVNPKYDTIDGHPCYSTVEALPSVPELAVIAVPPPLIPDLVGQLGALGTRGAIVISAGFAESGKQEGRELETRLLEAAKPHLMRLIGPNCVGILVPGIGLNASFAHLTPPAGGIAFATQSGAIVTSVIDWAAPRKIGFSHLISLGDMADVHFGDVLDYLANDPGTRAILLYIEAIKDPRRFMSAARAAARMKPVIVVKAGRELEGARAVSSHTGALAGADAAYDAAFRRAGLLRVLSLDELFDATETLDSERRPRGKRLAIISNGGGLGVLATDALVARRGKLAELAPATVEALNRILPPTWSGTNPIDIVGDASAERYGEVLEVLTADHGIDAFLVINCPTAVISRVDAARIVVGAVRGLGRRPLLTCWVGAATTQEARQVFVDNGIPTFDTPEQAVTAFVHLVNYHEAQELLIETPPSMPEAFHTAPDAARAVIDGVLGAGREWLTEPEAKAVLAHYAVPTVPTQTAGTPAEAASAAASLGGSVVLKLLSSDLTHKTDVGGVVLDLEGPMAVRQAATHLLERIRKTHPDASVEGFTVQPMVRRPGAFELSVGMVDDESFGPLIAFGQGGTAVEVIGDQAFGLPPLNMRLAREIIERTRVARLLGGYRSTRGANIDAIALTLIKVAQLVIDHPQIAELDINPLIADEYGVLALDARMRVVEASGNGEARLAIRPYPAELEETIPLADGRTMFLRPIRPEDEPALQDAFATLTPEEVRFRFFVSMKLFSHMLTARFTQIDYDRDMVLILTEPGLAGTKPIYGVVQINADPDGQEAEYAILVRHDVSGMGLGMLLMRRIIDYARARGIEQIHGDVLRDNRTMLKMCELLGFSTEPVPGDRSVVRVRLMLGE